MIADFLKSTISIAKALLPKRKHSNVSENNKIPQNKDKIIFQPNTIISGVSFDFPSNNNNNLFKLSANTTSTTKDIITIECDNRATSQLQGICRFFEINEFDALSKGIWLLSLIRDTEVNNKKLGIISLDKNGLITEVSPINVV